MQEPVLKEFREKVFPLLEEYADQKLAAQAHASDVVLTRFLRARQLNLAKAAEMFGSTLKWRKENNIDAIAGEHFPELAEFRRLVPAGFHRYDRHGRPVLLDWSGQLVGTTLFKLASPERLLRLHINQMEFLYDRLWVLFLVRLIQVSVVIPGVVLTHLFLMFQIRCGVPIQPRIQPFIPHPPTHALTSLSSPGITAAPHSFQMASENVGGKPIYQLVTVMDLEGLKKSHINKQVYAFMKQVNHFRGEQAGLVLWLFFCVMLPLSSVLLLCCCVRMLW